MVQGHLAFPRHQGQKDLDSRRHHHLQVDQEEIQRAPSSLAIQPSLRVRQSRDLYLLVQLHLAVLEVHQSLDVH